MSLLAVLPESLSVVAEGCDDETIASIPRVQVGKESSDLGIHVSYLATIGIGREPTLELPGRIVRGVGIVEMDPAEKW
jgi:hypothetical protein